MEVPVNAMSASRRANAMCRADDKAGSRRARFSTERTILKQNSSARQYRNSPGRPSSQDSCVNVLCVSCHALELARPVVSFESRHGGRRGSHLRSGGDPARSAFARQDLAALVERPRAVKPSPSQCARVTGSTQMKTSGIEPATNGGNSLAQPVRHMVQDRKTERDIDGLRLDGGDVSTKQLHTAGNAIQFRATSGRLDQTGIDVHTNHTGCPQGGELSGDLAGAPAEVQPGAAGGRKVAINVLLGVKPPVPIPLVPTHD